MNTVARRHSPERLGFLCPGCDREHVIDIGPSGWGWNGSLEGLTFTPSVLVRSGHFISGHNGRCWCDYNREHPDAPSSFKCERCHSFVTDGKIQFLSDCTHALAGQTVVLPPWGTP